MAVAQRIVDDVLKFDLDPPDEAYSTFDFGKQVANQIPDSLWLPLVSLSLQKLPTALASTFLRALFEAAPVPISGEQLLCLFGMGREVDSSTVLLELACKYLGSHPDVVAKHLLKRLRESTSFAEQDQLAYTLWFIFNGETLLIPEDKIVGYLATPIDQAIDEIIRTVPLSDYAKDTLLECKSTLL